MIAIGVVDPLPRDPSVPYWSIMATDRIET
jgi:hypothetical protein